MKCLLPIILAMFLGYIIGLDEGKHDTYRLVVAECDLLGGFFYGDSVISGAKVTKKH